MNKLQEYKIVIRRTNHGTWVVSGYWNYVNEWELDGEVKQFNTRKEALEFIMNQQGIPE